MDMPIGAFGGAPRGELDFVGLENSNLLRVVARAADIVQGQTTGGRRPAPEMVQSWLQSIAKWGLLHCASTDVVKRHMDNWKAIQNSQEHWSSWRRP